MTTIPEAPADTRIMGIVHDALRRDLERAVTALSTAPFPRGEQRVAIGEHVAWMMGFLHAHHAGEDAGLWPLVRERDPSLVPLLDAMEADHARIAPALEACETAAGSYRTGTDDATRVALLGALQVLGDVLLPHLRREEDEVMPAVSVTITAAEWRGVDQEQFVKPKSMSQLAFEGHWLLDGLDAERREVVVHQVATIPRLVLVHAFARRYRRRAAAVWGAEGSPSGRASYGPAPELPRRIPRSGRVEVLVPAPIEAVWRVVADVTRVGEWSKECRHVEWLDSASEAAPGMRFRGTNRAGPWRWSRVNEVLVADEPRTVAWRTVPSVGFPDSCEWRIELEPVGGDTRIVQSFKVLRAPAVLAIVYAALVPTHRGRSTELADDLRRLGEVAAEDARDQASTIGAEVVRSA
jgi:hypothetical protein